MFVDSHAHVISDNLDRYPPGPIGGQLKPGVIDHPITAEILLRMMDDNAVERAVLVQRAHIYGYDNNYVVDCAERYSDRLSAVCCIDARQTNAADTLNYWVRERGAVGVRLMVPVAAGHHSASNDPGNSWFAGETALRVWRAAERLQIPVCIYFTPVNRANGLRELKRIAAQMPGVEVVVDHLSNIDPTAGPPHFGFDEPLLEQVPLQNIYLKFATNNLAKWRAFGIDGAEVLSALFHHFGPDRIVWGSDIGQTELGYREMVDLAVKALEPFDGKTINAVRSQTTAELYFKNRPREG